MSFTAGNAAVGPEQAQAWVYRAHEELESRKVVWAGVEGQPDLGPLPQIAVEASTCCLRMASQRRKTMGS